MLPVYYTSVSLTAADVAIAKRTWEYVTQDTAPVYVSKLVEVVGFGKMYPTCLDWFTDLFYSRLFDIHPVML
jgi:hypothetical protein